MTIGKRAIRTALRARRMAADKPAIPVPPAFLARMRASTAVAAYIPIGGEADPLPFVRAAAALGCAILLPHVVDHATDLRFLVWDEGTTLNDGPFGLRQPADHAAACKPDVILTPLIGFDRRGNRLGQGAGHYDRAFATFPDAWRVGIAFSIQEVDALVPDPWDVPLHAIATEREWIVP